MACSYGCTSFWLSPKPCAGPGFGDVEMPWWTYGARGMQLWFPSSLADPLSPTTRCDFSFKCEFRIFITFLIKFQNSNIRSLMTFTVSNFLYIQFQIFYTS